MLHNEQCENADVSTTKPIQDIVTFTLGEYPNFPMLPPTIEVREDYPWLLTYVSRLLNLLVTYLLTHTPSLVISIYGHGLNARWNVLPTSTCPYTAIGSYKLLRPTLWGSCTPGTLYEV